MNEGKPGQKGEHSRHNHSTSIVGSIVNYRPKGRTLHRRESSSQAPTGKDVHYISYKKSTIPATQPKRNHYHPEFLLFSNEFSFNTTPPNFFFFNTYLFFETESVSGRGAETERERVTDSEADSRLGVVGTEPDAGLS